MQVPPQSSAKLGHWHEPVLQDFPPEHVVPQVPQLELLVCRLTHAPVQLERPVAQLALHTPLLHTSTPTHACEQVPQLLGLEAVSMQMPLLQSVLPAGHWQVPLQTLPPVHVVPQPPQLEESVVVSVQLPPQSVWPPGQVQVPVQPLPPEHAIPHAPQLSGLVAVSTHTPLPQSVWPKGH